MPLDEGGEVSHFGSIEVTGDESEVRGLIVGAIIAHGHVKQASSNVSGDLSWGLKGVGVHGPMRREPRRRGDVEEQRSSVGIDIIVGGKEVVEVAVVGASFVGVSSCSGPEVFSVPAIDTFLGDRFLGVNLDEICWLLGVLVKQSHRWSSFSVFQNGVIVDDVVESFSEFFSTQVLGSLVIVLGRCRDEW